MWLRYEPSGNRSSHFSRAFFLIRHRSARGADSAPHFAAEEVSIRQAQHAWAQGRQDLLGQGDLVGRASRRFGSEQDVRAVLHQGDEAVCG
jgi:hypothetical protein